MDIELKINSASGSLGFCRVPQNINIGILRMIIHEQLGAPIPERQLLRLQDRGKILNDEDTIDDLQLKSGDQIFLKDLGPQIPWQTVYLAEYTGPIFIYLFFYIFSDQRRVPLVVHIAAACNTWHYVKRVYETLNVHRFSHATMPIRNLFKNCAYYWGFTAFISWHINRSKYIAPSNIQVFTALILFILCEIGNFSIHVALRNLRRPGTKERRIPMPDGNIFTELFQFVSCPNYTYEICAWITFAMMTSCLPAFLFAFVGAYQMSIWALQKHQNYQNEFKFYPKNRQAIFPFIL